MASLRQIRGRIRSIQSTQQIMRAMQLVSASKLKRAQMRLLQARAVLGFLDGLLARVLANTPGLKHPLCATHPAGPDLLVLFTSDAGLCGSYNTHLIQMAESFLRRDSAHATELVFIGRKAHRYFTRRGFTAAGAYLDLAGRPHPSRISAIGRSLMERFLEGKIGSITLLYSEFVSTALNRPVTRRWLPIDPLARERVHALTRSHANGFAEDYIFEPSPQRIFEDLLPRWALATFQRVALEAFTSEHSARMIAMKNATPTMPRKS
ncbi:MAG: F0F1 ATP synthase subunit gamma [Candidatus Omnitrophica bacterium]|nr:F0F1 ATP synthase subunit gamma [Candidatus Omnitrophota bacterium]